MFQLIKKLFNKPLTAENVSIKVETSLSLFDKSVEGCTGHVYSSLSTNIKLQDILVGLVRNSTLPKHIKYYITDTQFYLIDRITNEVIKLSYNTDTTIALTLFTSNYKIKSRYIGQANDILRKNIDRIDKEFLILYSNRDYDDSEDGL